MSQPDVSIIIVTYNSEAFIRPCLERLQEQTYTDFEILVVDNGSRDRTVAMVREFSRVTLIQAEENLGFTGGNIRGLASAGGRYIVLLNPDTEAAPDWLAAMVETMETHPEAGIGAAKLIAYDSKRIDSAGDGCTVTGRGFKRGDKQSAAAFGRTEYVFGACGGAMMLRRSLTEEIGFLDNDFFLIYEDVDYSFRAQLAGHKCIYCANAIVYHKVRSSIQEMSELAVYYSLRNAKWLLWKNMPGALLWKYLGQHILQELLLFFFFAVKHGKFRLYIRANLDAFKAWPEVRKKRKDILRGRKISDTELEGMLTSLFDRSILKEKAKKMLGLE